MIGNFILYALLLGFIGFYIYMFAYKEPKIRKHNQHEWRRLKTHFVFSTMFDEKTLYNEFCRTLPRHWFLGVVYPKYYSEDEG